MPCIHLSSINARGSECKQASQQNAADKTSCLCTCTVYMASQSVSINEQIKTIQAGFGMHTKKPLQVGKVEDFQAL